MKWKLSGKAAMVVVSLLAMGGLAIPAPAQNPPASTYRGGPFQPVARIDPAKAVQIKIVNKNTEPVEFIVTTQTGFRRLAPGQSTQLSGIRLPAYLTISPIRDRTAIRYVVTTDSKNNISIVEVYPAGTTGHRSLNIDQTGGVYIF
jgi:hypothetical protein